MEHKKDTAWTQDELDQAVDYIIREGTENTASGNWCVSFGELEEHLGLTIQEGSGLDTALLDAVSRRPEVAEVEIADGCIDTIYYLDFCTHLEDEIVSSDGLAMG